MNFSLKLDPQTNRPYMALRTRGPAVLLSPLTNKGSAFTAREREELELHGLLPAAVCTLEQQLQRCYDAYRAKTSNLEKYIYLSSLQDRNETLFYRLVHEHIEEMLPIVYTPTVGEACQKFSHIYRRARGLYLGYDQRNHIERILRNFPGGRASVIVVTDGERILGLGDQGAGGMGIPVGKLCLYTLCAGVAPYGTLPIMLDVGTDNPERLADPLYLGLRQPRVRGAEYQEFVDRFVAAVIKVFPGVLLQWEDFLKGNALHQLARFRDQLCTFNDDIQGTAGVALAGLYAGLRLTGQRLREQRVLFVGAGAAAHGIADLLVAALREDGLTLTEARACLWTFDSKGLVTRDRAGLEPFKATYARDPGEAAVLAGGALPQVIRQVRPTMLVGTTAAPGAFDEATVQAMAAVNARPLIFPLSNPTSKSECTPADALAWSEGRALVATGSPYAPVEWGGRTFRTGQSNNAYIFPAVGLGVTVGGVRRVTEGMFLDAAKALAAQVSADDLAAGSLYPPLTRIREVSLAVACAVVRRAVTEGLADGELLSHLEDTLRGAMWFPEYLRMRYEG
jgi:malate dehydrogenase (oxaloacetate-decarboxylating)